MAVDPRVLKAFGEALDAVATQFCTGSYEDLIYMQAELARLDASKQTHPEVAGCLMGMADALEMAAFNFYASFK